MPAAIEAFGCDFLQSLLLLQSFAVISIFYHTSCRYYMTASFSGQPSAVPALCPLFPFAAIPAARFVLFRIRYVFLLRRHFQYARTANQNKKRTAYSALIFVHTILF